MKDRLYRSEEEEREAAELRNAISKEKENFYAMAETISRADARALETMGCKGMTKGEAVMVFFQTYKRNIDRRLKAHILKYPD